MISMISRLAIRPRLGLNAFSTSARLRSADLASAPEPAVTPKQCFVANIHWSVTESDLAQAFQEHASVISVRFVRDKATGRSRGFGFMEFETPEDAEKAVSLSGLTLGGRSLEIKLGKPPVERNAGGMPPPASPPSATVFIGNIPFSTTHAKLKEVFGPFGEIVDVRMPYHGDTRLSKGFAYVEYNNVEDATKAVEALNGSRALGRPIRLDFATSTPRKSSIPVVEDVE